MVGNAKRDGLTLILPQSGYARDHTFVSFRAWLRDDYPQMRRYISPGSGNQKAVAAMHSRVSSAPDNGLYNGETLNLALYASDLSFCSILRAEDVAVLNGNRTAIWILPLRKVMRKGY